MPYRSPARMLAPLALIAFLIALILVVSTSGGGGDAAGGGEGRRGTVSRPAADRGESRRGRRNERRRRVYVVKPGDILSSIAEKTGVSVEGIIKLNPDLDPQSLQAGQRIRLRS